VVKIMTILTLGVALSHRGQLWELAWKQQLCIYYLRLLILASDVNMAGSFMVTTLHTDLRRHVLQKHHPRGTHL
jgi:hypothetical protein